MFILDSFAFIAYLDGEPAKKRITEILEKAASGETSVAMSLINLGEVLYIIEREKGFNAVKLTLAVIHQLPIQILEVVYQQVSAAAHIKANYRVSYADAFAIAAAQTYSGTILTGDPEFHAVESLVQVEWLPTSC